MRRAVVVALTQEDRAELERIVRASTSPVRAVRRAQVVLLAAEGLTNQEIAERLGMGINGVARWRRRYVEQGLEASLQDRPGRGRRPSIPEERVAEVLAKTTTETPRGRTHWSRTSMAAAAGVSPSTVGRIWAAHGLKPHRVRSNFSITPGICDGRRLMVAIPGHRAQNVLQSEA